MSSLELARKALGTICYETFNLSVYASTGATCDDGWNGDLELDLPKESILYLLKDRIENEDLFKDFTLEEIDIDSVISEMSKEAACPNGGPSASVHNAIPKELYELSEELESLDETDKDAVKAIREKLKKVTGGKYTFCFTVEEDGYCFTENAEETIELTTKEVLGLLYGRYGIDTVFTGICKESYDEDLINAKADALGVAEDYNTFSYGGDCEQLEAYLSAWEYIIDSILSGDITEDNLDSWLEYFDDSDNYETDISDWYEDK